MTKKIASMAIIAIAGSVASADSIGSFEMKYNGGGMLRSGLNYQAIESTSGGNVTHASSVAGELKHQTRNRTGAATSLPQYLSSFCIELGQFTQSGYNDFEVVSIIEAPNPESNGPGDNAYGADVQRRIHAVVRSAIDAGYIDARLQPASGTTSAEMAAVQLGIWEAIWETSSDFDLSNGNSTLQGHNFGATNALNTALASLSLSATNYIALEASDFGVFKVNGLVALTSANAQDQLAIVPLPPAAFAGLGLLGAAGVVRRLRK